MRPTPVAAGFQRCRPGSVSRAANLGSSAVATRDRVRTMPLAVADLTNSRREIPMRCTFSLAPPNLCLVSLPRGLPHSEQDPPEGGQRPYQKKISKILATGHALGAEVNAT